MHQPEAAADVHAAAMAAIEAHIEQHLGRIDLVYHSPLSEDAHIDVLRIPPSESFPYVRFVTCGLSSWRMNTAGLDVPARAELMITLPADWPVVQNSWEDPEHYWPIDLLKSLARLPMQFDTWLGWGHSVPYSDPPQSYADNCAFTGCILLQPVNAGPDFDWIALPGGEGAAVYSVVPLYPEELALKLEQGVDALLAGFGAHGISDIVWLDRANAAYHASP